MSKNTELQIPLRLIGVVIVILAIIVMSFFLLGINDAGHRTVIQYPNGTLSVKFSPGIYLQLFGSVHTYSDVITYNFDKTDAEVAGALDQVGISIRYQDGGTGTVFGVARFSLPPDVDTMIKLHKDFRSNEGVAYKLIKPLAEESMNLTAGLMSSEEAYAEKRGIFTQWAQDQIAHGKFQTELQQIEETVAGEMIKSGSSSERRVLRNVPVIKYGEDGLALQLPSDLTPYGIGVTGFQITDWDFEQKTLDQIAKKREATMAIITAKADAERAKQEAITAEQEGLKNVMVAKYDKEVEKEKAVVEAQQKQEVAVIEAQQKVEVAKQEKLEAEQKKLAAVEYKEEQTLRGEGDAAYKIKVMEADGALEQKLITYENVMANFAENIGKQKWVPEVMFNGGSANESSNNEASNLINILTAKTLKDLGLDMTIKSQSSHPLQSNALN